MSTAAEIDEIITPDAMADAIAKTRADRAAGRISIAKPGEISREVLYAIHKHVDPDKVGMVISKMLDATRSLKDGRELPDTRTQEAGVKLYLAYMVGMPVQRTEAVNVNLDADSSVDIEARMENSPALLDQMEKLIERVKRRKSEGLPA
ncbi:MAG: hypothetical protein H7X97_00720 [Opitutaceae bacterium]|nr:hypothetical protein [Verrucomicrobiales bacterium]